MSTIYIVGPGQLFNYPADAVSEKIISNAGGRSKLTAEDRHLVKFKTVVAGQVCTDMPIKVRDLYQSRGWIITKDGPDISEKTPVAAGGK